MINFSPPSSYDTLQLAAVVHMRFLTEDLNRHFHAAPSDQNHENEVGTTTSMLIIMPNDHNVI